MSILYECLNILTADHEGSYQTFGECKHAKVCPWFQGQSLMALKLLVAASTILTISQDKSTSGTRVFGTSISGLKSVHFGDHWGASDDCAGHVWNVGTDINVPGGGSCV